MCISHRCLPERAKVSQVSVAVLVLNYNNWQETIKSIKALRLSAYKNLNILLIDNKSTNDSEKQLRSLFPDVNFIQTGRNLGYAGGNNVGIQQALSDGIDHILILNNDCILDKVCITEMVKVMQSDNSIGMVSPKVYEHDTVISHAGCNFSWRLPYYTASRGAGRVDDGSFDQPDFLETAQGDCLLVSSKMIKEIGLIPEVFFLYYEDTDWCYRARQAGWKIAYAPKAVAIHPGSLSTGGVNRPLGAYYVLRNKFLFGRRNGNIMVKLRLLVHGFLSLAKNCLAYLFSDNRPTAKARLYALLDAALNRQGMARRF